MAPRDKKGNANVTKKVHYIGVRKTKRGRYGSEIRDPSTQKRFWLGTWDTAEEAAREYEKAAKKLKVPHAKANFPSPHSEPLPEINSYNQKYTTQSSRADWLTTFKPASASASPYPSPSGSTASVAALPLKPAAQNPNPNPSFNPSPSLNFVDNAADLQHPLHATSNDDSSQLIPPEMKKVTQRLFDLNLQVEEDYEGRKLDAPTLVLKNISRRPFDLNLPQHAEKDDYKFLTG